MYNYIKCSFERKEEKLITQKFSHLLVTISLLIAVRDCIDLNITLFQAPSNSSMNVDFASYFMNNMKLYQTLSQLTAQPPDFSDPKLPWLDTKVWENIMTKYSQQLNNMQSR